MIAVHSPKEARSVLRRIVEPGDVICEKGDSGISRLIRFFTRHRGEPRTYSNHSAVVGTKDNVVEALTKVTSSDLAEWPFPHEFEIWRKVGLGKLARHTIAAEAESFEGQIYGALKIVPHAVDGLLGKFFGREVYLFRPLIGIKRFPICSWLVSWSYWTVSKYEFGVEPHRADPDHIHDHVSKSPLWRQVARRGPSGLVAVHIGDSNNA